MQTVNSHVRPAIALMLLGLVALVLGGCTETNHPGLVSQSSAQRSEAIALDLIGALARRDRAALARMGLVPDEIDAALADAPPLTSPPVTRFKADGRVGTRYFRQYIVTTRSTPPEIEVRVWLEQFGDGRIRATNLLVLPHVGSGEDEESEAEAGATQ